MNGCHGATLGRRTSASVAQEVVPRANEADLYLTALAALLTLVYVVGLIFRPQRRIIGMGVDSFVVLALYAVGIGGLFAISS